MLCLTNQCNWCLLCSVPKQGSLLLLTQPNIYYCNEKKTFLTKSGPDWITLWCSPANILFVYHAKQNVLYILCFSHRLFSVIFQNPFNKSLNIKGTRAMLTSGIAYKNMSSLQHPLKMPADIHWTTSAMGSQSSTIQKNYHTKLVELSFWWDINSVTRSLTAMGNVITL